ncbi:MAG TPA: Stk1 family PASTA domain-containing Ser/Thr kinase [Microbacteriaceae bacterium]|nr:Stk1 family PASTA domain-containing Ser/Thr kinase [Microbacteriaceae bacterium]
MNGGGRLVAGRYLVGDLVGRGGMSDVYRGRDTRLGRVVAIKFLKSTLADDPEFRARFRREAQAAARMTHPTIVRIFDAGEDDTSDGPGGACSSFIVMEYVVGTALREMIHGNRLDVTAAVRIASGILTALEYSHRADIVHRDIKPGNVMITLAGQVKVMDFGIARAITETATALAQTTTILGTAGYFSPEQARGEVLDARTDLYSTGVVLFEMLTGRPLFTGTTAVDVARQHIRTPAPPARRWNPAVSPLLETVVHRALAKDRDERYQSAREFRLELQAAHRQGAAATRARLATLAATGTPDPAYPHAPDTPDLASAASDSPVAATSPAEEEPARATPPAHADGRPPEAPLPARPGPAAPSEPSATPRHRTHAAWLWVTACALALAVVVAFGYWFVEMRPSAGAAATARTVPRLAGLTYEHAAHRLSGMGLTPVRSDEASTAVDPGLVIGTRPHAGASLASGDTVRLLVSSGPPVTAVPDVETMHVDTAEETLTAAGFTPGAVDQQDSSEAPAGTVVRTIPEAGSTQAEGTVVDMVVSSGTVDLPDLVGMELSDATDRLQAPPLGLAPRARADPNCQASAPRVVSTQSLPPGEVPQHSVVTLGYCTGGATTPEGGE